MALSSKRLSVEFDIDLSDVLTQLDSAAKAATGYQTSLKGLANQQTRVVQTQGKMLSDGAGKVAGELSKMTASAMKELNALVQAQHQHTIKVMKQSLHEQKALRLASKEDKNNHLKNEYEEGLLNEYEYLKAQASLNEKFDQEEIEREEEGLKRLNAAKKKAFDSEKNFNIGQIWANLASAIMGIWAGASKLGPIVGPIVAGVQTGVVTGIASAQSATVAKQTFVPAARSGGRLSTGGIISVGEEGQEFIDLPIGARITPLNALETTLSQAHNTPSVINMQVTINGVQDPKAIADTVAKELGRRISQGEF